MTRRIAGASRVYERVVFIGDDVNARDRELLHVGDHVNYSIANGRHHFSTCRATDDPTVAPAMTDEWFSTKITPAPAANFIKVTLITQGSDDASQVQLLGTSASDNGYREEIRSGATDEGINETKEIVYFYPVTGGVEIELYLLVSTEKTIKAVTCADAVRDYLDSADTGFVDITDAAKGKTLTTSILQDLRDGQEEVVENYRKSLVNQTSFYNGMYYATPGASYVNMMDNATTTYDTDKAGYFVSPSAGWLKRDVAKLKISVYAMLLSGGTDYLQVWGPGGSVSDEIAITSTGATWYTGYMYLPFDDIDNFLKDYEYFLQVMVKGTILMRCFAVKIEEEDYPIIDPTFHTLDTECKPPSAGNLPIEMTINGTAVEGVTFSANNASGTTWTASDGEVLDEAGSGSSPTYDAGSPLIADGNTSVKLNAAKHFEADNSIFYDIASEDFVMELVFKKSSTNYSAYFMKRDADDSEGWAIWNHPSGGIYLALEDAVPNNAAVVTAALTAGAWYHAVLCADRSGSAQWYINGKASGSAVSISSIGTMTNSTMLTVGAKSNGANNSSANIAYFGSWIRASWLDTHLQADIAQERFNQMNGLHPIFALGTKLPSVQERASAAYLEKIESGESKLYFVGDDWLRVEQWKDDNDVSIIGYNPEDEVDNDILRSQEFDNVAWTGTRLASFDVDGQIAPDGETTADGLVATAVSNTHYVGQAIGSVAGPHIFSVFAKPGDKDWIYIKIPTVANANAYYDISTGAMGTIGIGATAGIIGPYKNGFYRCWIEYTGGVPSHSHDIYAADDDGDHTYTGDGSTVNVWLWGAMHEDEGHTGITSYIKTEGSSVTREPDKLRFIGDDGNISNTRQGTYVCDVLNRAPETGVAKTYVDINDGGSANDQILLQGTTAQYARILMTETSTTEADITGDDDIEDNEIHQLAASWDTDDTKLFVDEIQDGTADSSCTPPNDLDRIDVGQNLSGAEQASGLIRNILIYDEPNEIG